MDEVSMPLGRKLTGLKFLDGNLEVICSAGMLNLLPKRQLDIEQDERIIGIVSRVDKQISTSHYDVKFKIAKLI